MSHQGEARAAAAQTLDGILSNGNSNLMMIPIKSRISGGEVGYSAESVMTNNRHHVLIVELNHHTSIKTWS